MAEQTSPTFDVFLSHNSKDKPAVIALAKRLEAAGVKVWLDVWELRPGHRWQEVLEEIISSTRSAAVLVGKDGLGPWEDVEMRACLDEFVKRKLPVIPVLLPDCPEQPNLPLLLRGFTWVDCRDGREEEGFFSLVWGITGVRPHPNPTASAAQEGGIPRPEASQPKDKEQAKTEDSDVASAGKPSDLLSEKPRLKEVPAKPSPTGRGLGEGVNNQTSRRWQWPLIVIASLMTAAVGYRYFTPSDPATPASESSAEASYWAKIKNSTDPADFSAYLQQYQSGWHKESAQILLDRLNAVRAEPKNLTTTTSSVCEDCPEMVPITGGKFQMGSDDGDKEASSDEKPKHEVEVASFKLGKYEVTRGQYAAFVKETNHVSNTDCDWNKPGFEQDDKHPVVCVSLTDTLAYITWLNDKTKKNFRLPTEAEWEYACRSGEKDQRYCGGDNVDALAWYEGNSGGKTQPVGGKESNGLGLFDMSGNVWEWNCSKYEEKYAGGELKCLGKHTTKFRRVLINGSWHSIKQKYWGVVRGGSWHDLPQDMRSAVRLRNALEDGNNDIGFPSRPGLIAFILCSFSFSFFSFHFTGVAGEFF